MKQLIEDNIYAFYDEIGSTLKTGYFKSPTITWLYTGNGKWPNMIYNTSFSEENINDFVAHHSSAIKSKNAPPFWLVEDGSLDYILAKKLSKVGMRSIMHWTGMGITNDVLLENNLSKGTQIKTVDNPSDLDSWKHILNSALMTSNKIKENIFENLYHQDNFELYLVLENDLPVATGLAYFSNNVCGVYMISTLEESRKKGFGSAVTKHCINAAYKKGITNIVLQASQKGVSIYEKIGFKPICGFDIFWMLGKDFK